MPRGARQGGEVNPEHKAEATEPQPCPQKTGSKYLWGHPHIPSPYGCIKPKPGTSDKSTFNVRLEQSVLTELQEHQQQS